MEWKVGEKMQLGNNSNKPPWTHVGVDSASGVIPVLHCIIRKIIYSSVGCAFLRCVHSVLMGMMKTHSVVLRGNPTALTRSDGTVDA